MDLNGNVIGGGELAGFLNFFCHNVCEEKKTLPECRKDDNYYFERKGYFEHLWLSGKVRAELVVNCFCLNHSRWNWLSNLEWSKLYKSKAKKQRPLQELEDAITLSEKYNKNCNKIDKKMRQVHFLSFKSIAMATNNFSTEYKLGEGGFGPAYKIIVEENY